MHMKLRACINIDRAFTLSSLTIKLLFGDFPTVTSARPIIIKASEIAKSHKDLQSRLIFIASLTRAQRRLTPLVAVNNSRKSDYLRHYFVTRTIGEDRIAVIKAVERSRCKTPRLSFPR